MIQALYRAALGTGFLFVMTALGAATVFFFAEEPRPRFQKAMLGFAAGIMTAASVWSLLLPAMEQAEAAGLPCWLPAAAGMLAGGVFLAALDALIPRLRRHRGDGWDGETRQSVLLMSAITLHNIPEGMAVGLACALAGGVGTAADGVSGVLTDGAAGALAGSTAGTLAGGTAGALTGGGLAGAAALALGIGVQNFPEGAAVSLPLRRLGRGRAFLYGTLSGAVEPLFGLLAAGTAAASGAAMPWLLSFAAGAMLYVTVEELIPQAHSRAGTCGYLAGFLLMMTLDAGLG